MRHPEFIQEVAPEAIGLRAMLLIRPCSLRGSRTVHFQQDLWILSRTLSVLKRHYIGSEITMK